MRLPTPLRASAAVAALALTLAACGGDDSGSEISTGSETASASASSDLTLVQDGTLTVCTDSPYAPMEFEEDGEFTGFDIELMRAVSEQLGLETQVINSGFDAITSGTAFASNQCDIAAASITITAERKNAVAFTIPYFQADQSLLVKKDGGITGLDGLDGESIGVQSGTTGAIYAEDNVSSDTEVISFDDPGGLFPALESGQIVGVLQDLVVNQGRAQDDDTVEVAETYPTEEVYGFAAASDNTDLVDTVDDALRAVADDGAYGDLFTEFFPDAEAPDGLPDEALGDPAAEPSATDTGSASETSSATDTSSASETSSESESESESEG